MQRGLQRHFVAIKMHNNLQYSVIRRKCQCACCCLANLDYIYRTRLFRVAEVHFRT